MPDPRSKAVLWTSYILSAIPVFMLLMSATMKVMGGKEVIEGMNHLGWEMKALLGLAIVELSCTVLYVIPRTSILGAILLTGYLGGATATHVRVSDPATSAATTVILGIMLWLGLWLREARLQALLPLKR